MSKILITIVAILIIVFIFISISSSQNMTVVKTDNYSKKPISIVLGKFQDSDCGMVIDSLAYASQVVSNDGKTWFFHDHGGMVHWISDKAFKDTAYIYVMSKDTKRWISGRTAWYSRTDTTPMLYGFGAYENKKQNLIDFETMSLYMLRGETMANAKYRQILLKKAK
ncbi:MAG: hypothetical protein B1H07_03670 [Campylobacteraceae bacterium 4484_166]|nr:MAG: hypothetical protein B1H07_03670 [Campylobacteraceae bacterium 4484_166]